MSDRHSGYLKDQIEMHRHLSEVYTEKRYAPAYSMIFQEHWNSSLCDLAGSGPGARVLDYGCGTGILLAEIERRGWRGVGLDLSRDMLVADRARGGRSLLLCADGCAAPIRDGSLDAVLCRGSIHHLPDLGAAFAEIARVLAPGGVLAFSEPSNDSPVNRIARRVMYRRSEEFHEEDEGFRRSEILGLLDEHGFDVEVSRGFGFLAYTLAGFPDKIGALGAVPGACSLTRAMIAVDGVLERLPGVSSLALHWQVRARKR